MRGTLAIAQLRDGENYQIGFVDIVDRPSPDMIEASRKMGDTPLYRYRLQH